VEDQARRRPSAIQRHAQRRHGELRIVLRANLEAKQPA
jgi:hypothetical protein